MATNDTFDLNPDPIVSGPKTFNDEPVIRLRGYVGERHDGKVRLYWDLSLTGYYDIRESDVVGRIRLSNDNGSVLIVKLSAKFEVVQSASVEASWLQGDITSTFLGVAGRMPFCPGISLHTLWPLSAWWCCPER